jgi:hypothetical protein
MARAPKSPRSTRSGTIPKQWIREDLRPAIGRAPLATQLCNGFWMRLDCLWGVTVATEAW